MYVTALVGFGGMTMGGGANVNKSWSSNPIKSRGQCQPQGSGSWQSGPMPTAQKFFQRLRFRLPSSPTENAVS